MERLNIQDLSKLRFTKVKRYLVDFVYDNQRYRLWISNSYEDYTKLFKRELNECGNYSLEFLMSTYGGGDLKNRYIESISNKTLVYNQINKEKFVRRLTWDGYCDSIYSEEINWAKEKIEKHKEDVRMINKWIDEMKERARNG